MHAPRQRLAVSAVLATALTVAVTAGCASTANKPTADPKQASSSPSTKATQPSAFRFGALLVSDGTSTVTVGGTKLAFPTTVTDAVWSPDGSRIAFVDADGNVDSAHPDGTGRLVLTKTRSGVTRSHPAWDGDRILYAQRGADGVSNVEVVYANGWTDPRMPASPSGDISGLGGENVPDGGNSAPSAANAHLSGGLIGETAFEHKGASGPEVWIVDQYQRGATAV